MAITAIEITQDNIVSGSDLLPVHSPLVFIAKVTYNTSIPDYVLVDIIDEYSIVLETLRANPYQDLSATEREFYFIADEVLRSKMNDFDDFAQTTATLQYVTDITKLFTIKFYDPVGSEFDQVSFNAIHGAAQFGSNPNLTNIYNNVTEQYVAAKNMPVYAYFYNSDTSRTLSVTVS